MLNYNFDDLRDFQAVKFGNGYVVRLPVGEARDGTRAYKFNGHAISNSFNHNIIFVDDYKKLQHYRKSEVITHYLLDGYKVIDCEEVQRLKQEYRALVDKTDNMYMPCDNEVFKSYIPVYDYLEEYDPLKITLVGGCTNTDDPYIMPSIGYGQVENTIFHFLFSKYVIQRMKEHYPKLEQNTLHTVIDSLWGDNKLLRADFEVCIISFQNLEQAKQFKESIAEIIDKHINMQPS